MATSHEASQTYEPIQTYQEYQDTSSPPPSTHRSALMSADGGPTPVAHVKPNASLDVAIPGEFDAREISSYMRVEGNEIFVETDGVRSLPQVYDITILVYNQVKNWTYIILTTLFSVLLAIIWGIMYAMISFMMIWWVNPTIRLFYIMVKSFSKLWSTGVQAFFDPLYLSFALIFSRAQVGVSLKQGTLSV